MVWKETEYDGKDHIKFMLYKSFSFMSVENRESAV